MEAAGPLLQHRPCCCPPKASCGLCRGMPSCWACCLQARRVMVDFGSTARRLCWLCWLWLWAGMSDQHQHQRITLWYVADGGKTCLPWLPMLLPYPCLALGPEKPICRPGPGCWGLPAMVAPGGRGTWCGLWRANLEYLLHQRAGAAARHPSFRLAWPAVTVLAGNEVSGGACVCGTCCLQHLAGCRLEEGCRWHLCVRKFVAYAACRRASPACRALCSVCGCFWRGFWACLCELLQVGVAVVPACVGLEADGVSICIPSGLGPV